MSNRDSDFLELMVNDSKWLCAGVGTPTDAVEGDFR
jgi:hypothetical protein